MTTLLTIVPSRGRPENAARILDAFAATITKFGSRLLLVVDDDDPSLSGYRALFSTMPSPFATLYVQSAAKNMGPILNHVALKEARTSFITSYSGSGKTASPISDYELVYSHIAFMGDDHVPRTQGWDTLLVQALDGKPGVSYGNDLLQGAKLPTAVVMSTDIIRALGYMCPPNLEHLFLDNFWVDLGNAVGNLKYLDKVIIEHIHPLAGKADWTAAYKRTCGAELMGRDGKAYYEFLCEKWPGDLLRLRMALK